LDKQEAVAQMLRFLFWVQPDEFGGRIDDRDDWASAYMPLYDNASTQRSQ
jgi:hypothetical protein